MKTLKGVFMRKPLQCIKNAGMNKDMQKMLDKFKAEVDVTPMENVATPDAEQCQ